MRQHGRALSESLDRLRAIGVEIAGAPASSSSILRPLAGWLWTDSGLLAFDQALLILPAEWRERLASEQSVKDLLTNCPHGQVFALDLFGQLFVATPHRIVRVNPETREVEDHSPDAEAWAARILREPNFETGWELATKWQLRNRPLQAFERLLPRELFVLGGDFTVENLVARPLLAGLAVYAGLSAAIADVPDGTVIEFKVLPEE